MKFCAIVVLYNPEETNFLLENFRSYEPYVEKFYLVDNSETEHAEIAKQLKNAEYISNKNHGGIGGAQNAGCNKAMSDGFEWAMTMDQDTAFEAEQIQKYVKTVEDFIQKDGTVASYSLRAENLTDTSHWTDYLKALLRPIKRRLLGVKKMPSGSSYVVRCIASANIIRLAAWLKTGGFNEKLFIDQVDYDFCYRLSECGYKIVKFNDIYMNQHFGEAHGFTLFRKRYAKYSDFRFYHCIRNSFIMINFYPQHKKFYDKYIRDLFFDNCVNSIHIVKNLKLFFRARNDALIFISKNI